MSLAASDDFASSNLRFTDYERPVSIIQILPQSLIIWLTLVETYLVSVRPSCEEDVVATMKYGREKGLPFSPRAGHHCVTTTMRHLQDGILIDMRSLNGLSYDEKNRQVTVGGGVITDDFVRFLESKGMEVSKLIFIPILT